MQFNIILLLFLHSMSYKKVYSLLVTALAFAGYTTHLKAQDKVTFIATDKLIVTADAYIVNDTLPYMILCHDLKSSRGEYKDLAKKFSKLGYNCLAVDLRNGGTSNGVDNETANLATLKHLPATPLDAKLDIEAAITYAHNKNNRRVVLVGSGYSASLALYVGATDARVAGVLAFSPEDYFKGKLATKDVFNQYVDKPVYIASTKGEQEDVKKYTADISESKVVQFAPPKAGVHGSAALLVSDDEYHDYWISILMFTGKIKP
jgi:dienelactone hydrolase